MKRATALKLLRGGEEGIAEWNRLRKAGESIPNLRRVDLRDADLTRVNLTDANLNNANFCGAHLYHADLSRADLSHAALYDADLDRALLLNAILRRSSLANAALGSAKLRGADLSYANLMRADLSNADLRGATLSKAFLAGANLSMAKLNDANLSEAFLGDVDFGQASLTHANFSDTVLLLAVFHLSDVEGAHFERATFGHTVVACDFSRVFGLGTVVHVGPSEIAVSALQNSEGYLPTEFLRGCGLSDKDIAHFHLQAGRGQRSCTCFISYSSVDEKFATRLYDDFQAAGIRCWKWDRDARTGRSLWGEISKAIPEHERLVLIASEASLKSPAVNREIERAIQEEDTRFKRKQADHSDIDTDVLFPVRLDDFIFRGWEHERRPDVIKKVIADARGWDKDPQVYKRVLRKLIRDLTPTRRGGA